VPCDGENAEAAARERRAPGIDQRARSAPSVRRSRRALANADAAPSSPSAKIAPAMGVDAAGRAKHRLLGAMPEHAQLLERRGSRAAAAMRENVPRNAKRLRTNVYASMSDMRGQNLRQPKQSPGSEQRELSHSARVCEPRKSHAAKVRHPGWPRATSTDRPEPRATKRSTSAVYDDRGLGVSPARIPSVAVSASRKTSSTDPMRFARIRPPRATRASRHATAAPDGNAISPSARNP
jgi:hypothetical protein